MAGLGCEQTSHVVKDVAHRLVDEHRADLVPQEVCSGLWCLAVLDVLDIATLKLFWSIIVTKFHGKVAAQGVRPLYQALYKVKPLFHDSAWQQLKQEMTGTLGPVHLLPSQQSSALHAVLQTLQLEHSRAVPFSVYTAAAVLRQRADGVRNMLLVTLNAEDHVTNVPGR